jgi:hypothetical protein
MRVQRSFDLTVVVAVVLLLLLLLLAAAAVVVVVVVVVTDKTNKSSGYSTSRSRYNSAFNRWYAYHHWCAEGSLVVREVVWEVSLFS